MLRDLAELAGNFSQSKGAGQSRRRQKADGRWQRASVKNGKGMLAARRFRPFALSSLTAREDFQVRDANVD